MKARAALLATLAIASTAAGASADDAPTASLFASTGVSAGAAVGAAGVETGGGVQQDEVDPDDGDLIGWRADYRARGEVRGTGDGVEGSVTARGAAVVGSDLGRASEVPLFSAEVDGGVGVRPSLDARRDVGREAYTHGGARGHLTLAYVRRGNLRAGGLDASFGSRAIYQAGRVRVEHTMQMRGWFRCWLRADGLAPRCTDYFVMEAIGVTGGTEAVIGTLIPVRWRGLALPGDVLVDVSVGGLSNQGTMTIEQDGEVIQEIATEDLPAVSALAWDVAARRSWDDLTIEARSRRSGWITLDGDMSIEERQSVAASARRGKLAMGAGGFAARTTWWTSRTAPSQVELTAGGDAWLTGPLAGVDAEVRVAAGRSFYAALDGMAPLTPGVGVDATLTLRRTVARAR